MNGTTQFWKNFPSLFSKTWSVNRQLLVGFDAFVLGKKSGPKNQPEVQVLSLEKILGQKNPKSKSCPWKKVQVWATVI
jgi:hypothetical protein